jgi:uncharacterized membrane protein YwzB
LTNHKQELPVVAMFGNESPVKDVHFVPICLQIWPLQAIPVSDWLISKKSFPLKPLGQIVLTIVLVNLRHLD